MKKKKQWEIENILEKTQIVPLFCRMALDKFIFARDDEQLFLKITPLLPLLRFARLIVTEIVSRSVIFSIGQYSWSMGLSKKYVGRGQNTFDFMLYVTLYLSSQEYEDYFPCVSRMQSRAVHHFNLYQSVIEFSLIFTIVKRD